MATKSQIADLLRGESSVTAKSKTEFQVKVREEETATLTLKKEGLYIGGGRTVPFEECKLYLDALLGETFRNTVWKKKEHRRHTALLALMYGNRAFEVEDTYFLIDDEDNPTVVHLGNAGTVEIHWSGDSVHKNIYDYYDSIQDLTLNGQTPIPNVEMTGFATMEEIEKNPHMMNRLLSPAHPSPPTISNEAMRANLSQPIISTMKQYWHDVEGNCVFVTKKGVDVRDIIDRCLEIDKPRMKELIKRQGVRKVDEYVPAGRKSKRRKGSGKRRGSSGAPRGKGLGVGGNPLDKKSLKDAQSKLKSITAQGKRIRMLILEFDADNETICDLVECEDKVVQRTRRAILREKK